MTSSAGTSRPRNRGDDHQYRGDEHPANWCRGNTGKLRYHPRDMIAAHPDQAPGMWKIQSDSVAATTFAYPEGVLGAHCVSDRKTEKTPHRAIPAGGTVGGTVDLGLA